MAATKVVVTLTPALLGPDDATVGPAVAATRATTFSGGVTALMTVTTAAMRTAATLSPALTGPLDVALAPLARARSA